MRPPCSFVYIYLSETCCSIQLLNIYVLALSGSSRWSEKLKEKDQQIEHLTRKLQQYEEENKTKTYAMEKLVNENRRLHVALATLQQKYDNGNWITLP